MARAGIFAPVRVSPPPTSNITSFARILSSFQRSTATTHSRTVTFNGAYTSNRWLVGLAFRRLNSTTATVTVDSVTPTYLTHVYAASLGYTWYVAQPTGATANVQFTTTTTAAEYAFVVYEVYSPTQPLLYDAMSGTSSAAATVNTVNAGAAMGYGLQTSSTAPSGTLALTAAGSGGGWFAFEGSTYPTSGASLNATPVNNGLCLVSIY